MLHFAVYFTTLCALLPALTSSKSIQTRSDSITKIFDFLEQSSKNFTLGEQKDVVVVLGNTGSGKSTLTLLITGAELIAVETDEGSGEYVVKDKRDLISPPDQTTKSQTIIPNLLIDKELTTSYYDCAGFEDSRGVDHDISVTYLIQKLLKYANSVKFVFTVAHSSVKIGGDRHDFKKLARHATTLITNIDKYRDGIALVVNKVETKVSNGQIVTDEKTIENIAKFLNQTLSDLSNEEPAMQPKMTRFIEILLGKNQYNQFNRIQILRVATESGSFNEMPFPKAERAKIRSLVSKTLQYVQKDSDDFGYSISSDSKLRVHELFVELEQTLMKDVNLIGDEIQKFYQRQQDIHSADKHILLSMIISANDVLPEINADNMKLFKKQLASKTSALKVPIADESLKTLDRHIDFVYFLESVSDAKLSSAFKISNGLKNVISFLTELIERSKVELVTELKANLTTDIRNIDAEIESIYLQIERETSDITILHDKIQLGHQKLSSITTKNPKLIANQITDAINSLALKVSADKLTQFKKHIDVIEFLDSVNTSSISIEIDAQFTQTMQYLYASKNWYTFLTDLPKVFAEYKVQQNVEVHNASELHDNINRIIDEIGNSVIKFEDTGIKEFLQRISDVLVLDSIKLNAVKLKLFNELLHQSMLTKIEAICESNELSVKGYFVKMSEVFAIQCDARLIKVMAVFKTFVDADINAEARDLQMHIISPTWEVIGDRTFNMNGRHAENYDSAAPDGAKGVQGNPGQPGKPGGPGGYFLGVGDSFINGANLKIFQNGGNGGAGQNGGNGGDGDQGEYRTYGSGSLIVIHETTRYATPSGAGGHGGCGGLGGRPGKFLIVDFMEPSTISMIRDAGNEGAPGRGGSSKPTWDIGKVEVRFGHTTILDPPHSYAPPGGGDGYSCDSRQPASEVNIISPSNTINVYKSYIREQLSKNTWESSLRKFVENIETSAELQALYNIHTFVDEIMSLEKHYFQLREKIAFRPFYVSLLNRLNIYEQTIPQSDENRKVLNYLYAAVLSQINSNIASQRTILNLRDYLTEAQIHITDIRVIGREIRLHNTQIQYTNSLNAKMDSAKELIGLKILPEMNRNLDLIESNFVALVDETIEKKKQVNNKIEEYEEKLREMKRAMRRQKIFGGLKILGSALSFFGPVGAAAGAVIGAGSTIAEAAMGKPISESTINGISSSVKDLVKALKYNNILFKQQLEDITNELNSNDKYKEEFKELHEKLEKMRSDVEKADKEGTFQPIVSARLELQEMLKGKKIAIETQKPNELTLLKVINKAQDIAQIIGMSVESYNQIKNSEQRMHEVVDAIRGLKNELVALQQYEEQIYNTMIPIFHATENYLKLAKDSLANGGSHVQLDIKKWEIKNRLVDVKYMFSQMTAASGTHDDFQHYFGKVEATMDILIDVYDRIESISDHVKFVDYITQIASNGQNITSDPQFMQTINRMDEIIQTNTVLEKHTFVIHAFKQHYFPFAPLFLDKFNLPPHLRFNDTDALKENAIKQIKDLNSGVIISDATLGSKDIYLFSDIQFDSNDMVSVMPPFYIWKSQEHKNEIQKLLRGEEIIVKADVVNEINNSAIKFNRIGIYLNSPNQTVQTKLNEAIGQFDLTMKIIGENVYRCDKRLYHLPIDGNIVIEQSMRRDANGIPIKQNDVYRKISESNYFLSPYTMWSIQLENQRKNVSLTEFENEIIDIELVGRGQYLKNIQSVSHDVCSQQLDEYYFLDAVLNDVKLE